LNQADRVAALWRKAQAIGASRYAPVFLLDAVVEPFIREIGRSLEGAEGSAWTRTAGVLRLSHERGLRSLLMEFDGLRRCLVDALGTLASSDEDVALVEQCVNEAAESAAALFHRVTDPTVNPPKVQFGGLVVQFFEQAAEMRAAH
jgi:hypothetical protein